MRAGGLPRNTAVEVEVGKGWGREGRRTVQGEEQEGKVVTMRNTFNSVFGNHSHNAKSISYSCTGPLRPCH